MTTSKQLAIFLFAFISLFYFADALSEVFLDPLLYPAPTVQRPLPVWGCIECTYANREMCCRYFQRCCATAVLPGLGKCQLADVYNKCPQQCSSDGQCPSGQRCCPQPSLICVTPFGLSECPLSVNPLSFVRPCSAGCLSGELCCPDPRTPGCCVTTRTTGPIQPGSPTNTNIG